MSQYKVLQDIEAEDKLLGPLSLRQFIYAGGAALLGYLSVVVVTKGVAFLLVVFVPPMLFCMFFAWPWSPDQPTEVWALARIRFLFKSRRRLWDQSGAKDLVTITAPKRVERVYTDGLTQTEVKSRLAALADTIDSRGWAVKNNNVNMPTLPSYDTNGSDRLVNSSSLPQIVSDLDIHADDDMLDERNNPVAQQFEQMMQASSQAHRQRIVDQLAGKTPPPTPGQQPAQPQADYWFMHEQGPAGGARPSGDNVVFANPQVVRPGVQPTDVPIVVAADPTPDEEALAQQMLQRGNNIQQFQNMHLRTIQPVGNEPAQAPQPIYTNPTPPTATNTYTQPTTDPYSYSQMPANQPPAAAPIAQPLPQMPPVTPPPDPAILSLASSNDLDVATIARQAQKVKDSESSDGEVVISLR